MGFRSQVVVIILHSSRGVRHSARNDTSKCKITNLLRAVFLNLSAIDIWGWIIPCHWGANLYIAGCGVLFLVSVPQGDSTLSPPVVTSENVSRHCHMSSVGHSHPQMRTKRVPGGERGSWYYPEDTVSDATQPGLPGKISLRRWCLS